MKIRLVRYRKQGVWGKSGKISMTCENNLNGSLASREAVPLEKYENNSFSEQAFTFNPLFFLEFYKLIG